MPDNEAIEDAVNAILTIIHQIEGNNFWSKRNEYEAAVEDAVISLVAVSMTEAIKDKNGDTSDSVDEGGNPDE